ncbi:hypothetical protein BDV19DRAFT_287999 [Aspergillus venezuelensis]
MQRFLTPRPLRLWLRPSVESKPAHWFRAQLVHYGLRATDKKGMAAMRLFDAFRSGNLVVPEHLRKLEGEMKREWLRSVRGTGSKGEDKKVQTQQKQQQQQKKQVLGKPASSEREGHAARVRHLELESFGAGAGFAFSEGLVDEKSHSNVRVSNVNINYYGRSSAA